MWHFENNTLPLHAGMTSLNRPILSLEATSPSEIETGFP
jgi:hypothetical protein